MLLNLDERKVAAELLMLLLSHFSREHFGVNWSPAAASRLWEAAQGRSDQFPAEGAQARYLAEKCQGWVVGEEAAGQPKVISLSEWEGVYYKLRKPPASVSGKEGKERWNG